MMIWFNPIEVKSHIVALPEKIKFFFFKGFNEHPHRNMEICTYVVRGELTHQDSLGTKETLSRGAVQFMSAGTGVKHAEHNFHKEKDLRVIQIWIEPREPGLKPNYGSYPGDDQNIRRDRW
jgi:redox-sensitive bicupin YhaK (pirin superfamily)